MPVDDILSLIVVFIFYLIAVSSGKKRKKKRSERRRAFAKRMEQAAMEQQRAAARRAQPQSAADMKKTSIQRELEERDAGRPCHDTPRMHLHDVTDAQMTAAAEGEDPCHQGGALSAEMMDSPVYVQETEQDRQALAQDVLRGVIMSEILTRPRDRMAMYRSRRSIR